MKKVAKKGGAKAGGRKPAPKNAKDKPLTPRRAKFADNYAENGGNGKKAAEDAGFAKGAAAEVEASRLLRIAKVRERIAERIAEAGVDKNEVIGTLASHMRADFADLLPRDAFMQEARRNGVSHLVREVEITERLIMGEEDEPGVLERKYKIKIHDSQAAAKQLCSVLGLNKKEGENPEDERDRVERAIAAYIARTGADREEAIKNLMPFIPEVSKYAN